MKREPIQFEVHPLAELLPRLGGAEYDALRDDIAAHGLQQPIVVYEGKILDGRHRYDACRELGIEPMLTAYGGINPAAFVLSSNVHRRHLTAGQQASVFAQVMLYAEANPPKVSGKLADCHVDDKPTGKLAGEPTMQQVAKAAGVGERTLRDAKKVAAKDPELSKKVVAGEVTLPAAVERVTGKRPGKDDGGARLADLERQVAELTAQRDQLAEDNKELLAENEAMAKIIDADDRLRAASAEIKKLQGQIGKLEQRIQGLQNEKNAAVRAAKAAQKKAGK
jgi:hypothetical protein